MNMSNTLACDTHTLLKLLLPAWVPNSTSIYDSNGPERDSGVWH